MTLVAAMMLIANQRDIAIEAERNVRQMAEAGRQELYAAQVNLAHQAWVGDIQRAHELLASQRPTPNQKDLRGFEWRYVWQLCQDESRQTLGIYGPSIKHETSWWLNSSPDPSFSADG